MKSTIICIGRQYGSGGREVGEKLAKRLGVTCYDKLLIQQTAKDAGLAEEAVAENDERPIGLCAMVSGNPFADSAALSKAFYSEEQRVFEAERQAIVEIAAKGPCVIIGRCASSVLRSLDYDILSVFVYADSDDRARRIAERNGISEKAALEMNDAKYEVLMNECETALLDAKTPFEKAFEVTKDNEIKVNIAAYLKNIYYRFYSKGAEWEEGYNKYSEIVKNGIAE